MRIPMDFQMAIANTAVVPSMNPAGAGILYAEDRRSSIEQRMER